MVVVCGGDVASDDVDGGNDVIDAMVLVGVATLTVEATAVIVVVVVDLVMLVMVAVMATRL